ncbi:acetate/propionate family kinase [Elioraea thermophila]|uniref:acetate/propionate family kinase n=1 Tax=Elioraea thermophila TaxID=2185104 RepID=UPI000DF2233C|nr:acetate/propionate family kinase [Elioraea thermophila]
MPDAILVLNAGSSSLKFTAFALGEDLSPIVSGLAEELSGTARFRAKNAAGEVVGEHAWSDDPPGHDGALAFLFAWLREHVPGMTVRAVGHRVVHGGATYAAPVRIDADLIAALEALVPLAPLHQPHNLLPIRLLAEKRPDLPQVACFDTAFHRTAPDLAQAFALPAEITARGVRRYGFHGLSYEYIARTLPQLDPRAAAGRTIVLHLGNGASACALLGGRSIASTMGFTAVDGLMMGTRTGALDPGVVLYLMDELGMDARAIEDVLYRRSGLLGVSGLSSDMRVLLASEDPAARFAVELFCYRIVREVGSLVAALEGLDALVFTAGIGENAAPIRAKVCAPLAWLGVALDEAANEGRGLRRISTEASRVAVWVVPTDEERMIARHVRELLSL